MTTRPDVFNREAFEQSLLRQGCPEEYVQPTVSNFKLFVPLLFDYFGEQGAFQILSDAGAELGLGKQEAVWRISIHYIVGWANQVLDEYKSQLN